jgi:hypothetical protein
MKFKLVAICTEEEDGYDVQVAIDRNNVSTVEDALVAYSQFLRAVGFTYIDQVGATSSNSDKEWWSGF